MTTDTPMTPARAIRSAIQALQREIVIHRRDPDQHTEEVVAQINEEIAALETAIATLKQYEQLKAVLKAVVSE